jgi:DNA-directed RNA polymerase subunit RPC12/RpoP
MKKEIKIRCPNCGYEGKPVLGRSGILEILLFVFTLQFLLIPFFLYEHFTTKWKCPKCGFRNVVKLSNYF